MIDRLHARIGVRLLIVGAKIEVDLEQAFRAQVGRYEIDEAAIRRPDGGYLEFSGPDRAIESDTLQRGRAIQRPDGIIGKQSHRADRGTAIDEVFPRDRIRIRVQDQVDVALAV